MSKEKTWCDWSDLFEPTELKKSDDYKHNPTALFVNNPQGIAPKGDAAPRLAKGEVPKKPSNEEIAKAILHNAPKQPTDEEMFGGGVVSEEEATKRQQEWENRLQKSLTMPSVGTPLDEEEWGNCKSFNSTLTPEEIAQRNMFTGE